MAFNDFQNRIIELVDMPLDRLRCIWADFPIPTKYQNRTSEARTESKGWTRGELVAEIINSEFKIGE